MYWPASPETAPWWRHPWCSATGRSPASELWAHGSSCSLLSLFPPEATSGYGAVWSVGRASTQEHPGTITRHNRLWLAIFINEWVSGWGLTINQWTCKDKCIAFSVFNELNVAMIYVPAKMLYCFYMYHTIFRSFHTKLILSYMLIPFYFPTSYLCSWSKSMTKIDAYHSSGGQTDHKVWQMSVTNSQHVLRDAQEGMSDSTMTTQHMEGLWGGTHLLESSPGTTVTDRYIETSCTVWKL